MARVLLLLIVVATAIGCGKDAHKYYVDPAALEWIFPGGNGSRWEFVMAATGDTVAYSLADVERAMVQTSDNTQHEKVIGWLHHEGIPYDFYDVRVLVYSSGHPNAVTRVELRDRRAYGNWRDDTYPFIRSNLIVEDGQFKEYWRGSSVFTSDSTYGTVVATYDARFARGIGLVQAPERGEAIIDYELTPLPPLVEL